MVAVCVVFPDLALVTEAVSDAIAVSALSDAVGMSDFSIGIPVIVRGGGMVMAGEL